MQLGRWLDRGGAHVLYAWHNDLAIGPVVDWDMLMSLESHGFGLEGCSVCEALKMRNNGISLISCYSRSNDVIVSIVLKLGVST